MKDLDEPNVVVRIKESHDEECVKDVEEVRRNVVRPKEAVSVGRRSEVVHCESVGRWTRVNVIRRHRGRLYDGYARW